MNRITIPLVAAFALSAAIAHAGPVPQETGYRLDYSLNLTANHIAGNSANGLLGLVYTTNNSGSIPTGSFDRVAYELTLSGSTNPNSPNGNVWVSFNAQSNVANQLGVPTLASGELYQQSVSNMNVIATPGSGVTDATGLANGNIQFWPSNYNPNGATGTFDWNDGGGNRSQGYGAMEISQITNVSGSTGNMFISFNNWSGSSGYDAGLGNNTLPANGFTSPNYTFRNNIGDYSSAVLTVWVAPEPTSLVLCGLGAIGLLLAARRRRRAAGPIVALAIAMAACSTPAQAAPMHAVDLTSSNTNNGYDVGWAFSITKPIEVTELGKFVIGNTSNFPLANSQVGIYQNLGGSSGGSGALLVSATVLATAPLVASSTLDAQYVSIAPFLLSPGNYVIFDRQNTALFAETGAATFAPAISYVAGVATNGQSSSPLPTTLPVWNVYNSGAGHYFGPTFQFTSLPEPTSFVLFGLGAVGLLLAARRRRRAAGPIVALAIAMAACSTPAQAAPLMLSGWNADDIVGASEGSPYSTGGFNGFSFYQQGLPNSSQGFPANNSGVLSPAAGTGTVFQFAPYAQNNAYLIGGGGSGTLTLATPQHTQSLQFLDVSQYTTNWNVTLNFTTGHSTTIPGSFIDNDWTNGPPSTNGTIAFTNYGLVNQGTPNVGWSAYLYAAEHDYTLSLTDQARLLTSFTITSTSGNLMFLAASSVVGAPEPSSLLLCGLGAIGLFVAARRRRG